jgi:hypothetical protein
MSNSAAVKKEIEERDLCFFLREFEYATGITMTVKTARERPDFEVLRGGKTYGLELVRVMLSPRERLEKTLLGEEEQMSDSDDSVQMAIHNKEKKRASTGWGFPDSTILIVQLIGARGRDVFRFWDEDILEELRATGFFEIWMSDHGPLGPHGTVEIIGVKPEEWEGIHTHSKYGGKPYG